MAFMNLENRQMPVMRHKPRVCRYRGVSTHKQSGKWVAQIKSGGKQVYLGFYSDQEDAARAYDQAIIHMQVGLLAFLDVPSNLTEASLRSFLLPRQSFLGIDSVSCSWIVYWPAGWTVELISI